MKSPVFIFALPRSGSTLLQRVLMSHKEITSLAELWILLPFIYSIKIQAYKKESLLKSLNNHKPKFLLYTNDLLYLVIVKIIINLNLNLFFSKRIKTWIKDKYLL